MTRPALHLVNPETGELVETGCPDCAERDATIAGLQVTINSQAGIIGKQRAELEERLENHPRRAEITAIIDHWRKATKHPRSKVSADRAKLVADRLKDDYSPETLRLAIDGLAAFPYRHYAERRATGPDSQRDDKLSTALASGEAVERFANLGHSARQRTLLASSLPPPTKPEDAA